MTHFRVLLLVCAAIFPLAATIAGGCSTSITVRQGPEGGQGGEGGFLFLNGGGGEGPDASLPDGALPDYEDPGCKNKPPPIYDLQCDPYEQNNGDCPPGEGCYIYVDYPSEPCGQEVYGALCFVAGTGQQGDGCGGAMDCAGGFVCVITGSGTQCVELCQLQGESGCPPGLVCEPIDVVGFGGCL